MKTENKTMARRCIRAPLLHCLKTEGINTPIIEYCQDGLLIIETGYIVYSGSFADYHHTFTQTQLSHIEHYPDKLIVPGFIDCHVHYPQTEMIGAYGTQLLDWLNQYTFPVEAQFIDRHKAQATASVFCQELLRNGTTTALVFCSTHEASVEAFFDVAHTYNLRMIAGKVLMDRHAPPEVLDTVATGYEQSLRLIQKWHGTGRMQYAVTPRFAPTSSQEQLNMAGRLLQQFPDVYLHTHLSENKAEIQWVAKLYPQSKNYLDVYDQAGLLGRRSIFAHGLHLCDAECHRLQQTQSSIAHCPTSNLFMGSGLFPMQQLDAAQVTYGIGTDIGGGTSFSMLHTLAEAYKVQQLQGVNLTPEKAFYLATLGGAQVLDIDDKVGNFAPGKEADFLILDPAATPLLKYRTQYCNDWRSLLFALQILGDDRVIWQTNIMGQPVSNPL